MRKVFLASLCCLLAMSSLGAEAFSGELLNDPFTVHGRLRNYMGFAEMRIWVIGTTRMFGIVDDTAEARRIQALFPKGGFFDHAIYADFTVEPLAPDIKGHKRPVRILKVKNVVVEGDSDKAIVLMKSELDDTALGAAQ